MIYEIVRIIWVNIEKYNKRGPTKSYLRQCNEIAALKQKISKLYAEDKKYVEECNDLESQVRLSVKNTERYFNNWTEENKRCLALLSTITGLEYQNKDLKTENKRLEEENKDFASQISILRCENAKLEYENKDLLEGVERLKKDNTHLAARNDGLFTDWRKEVLNNEANETRIKELEAALPRAEGLNKAVEPITKPNH